MASRVEISGGWAVRVVAVVWIVSAVSVAAQSRKRFDVEVAREANSAIGVSPSPAAVSTSAEAVLEEMTQAAGVIFAGQVMAVRKPPGFAGSGEDAAEGVVEVDFQVDQAVRGPVVGSVYTLREWSGLWNAIGGGERYRVGQRLLVFLHEPDLQGLSSPVHGRDGAVPLRGGGVAPGPDDGLGGAAEWMVDLRWLQTLALRNGALVELPVRRPVSPRPVGFFPEENVWGDGNAPTIVRSVLTRPTARLLETAPVEMEPLPQVLALCLRAMEQTHGRR